MLILHRYLLIREYCRHAEDNDCWLESYIEDEPVWHFYYQEASEAIDALFEKLRKEGKSAWLVRDLYSFSDKFILPMVSK